jgi:hypothetical protein
MLLSVIYKCMLFLPTVIFMSFYMYLVQDFHFFLTYLHSMRNFYSTIFFFFFFFLNKDAITVEFPPSNSIQTLHLHLFQSSNLAVYTHRQHVAGSSTVVLGEG